MIEVPARFIRVLKSIDLEIWGIRRKDWTAKSPFGMGVYIIIEDLGRPDVVEDPPWLSARDKEDFEAGKNLVHATIISTRRLEPDIIRHVSYRIETELLEHMAFAHCTYTAHFQVLRSFKDLEAHIAERAAKIGVKLWQDPAFERLTQTEKRRSAR